MRCGIRDPDRDAVLGNIPSDWLKTAVAAVADSFVP